MVPAAPGTAFTTMEKFEDEIPAPHALIPATVRLPEVAPAEKLPVMEALFPDGVNPVPE